VNGRIENMLRLRVCNGMIKKIYEQCVVQIQAADGSTDDRTKHPTYVLPAALLSYHSPFLEAECKRVTEDPLALHIALPDVDPAVFTLFFEWMCKWLSVLSNFDN
jgi:hypothetical protein